MLDRPVFSRAIDGVGVFRAVRLRVSIISRRAADRTDEFAELRARDLLSLWIPQIVADNGR